jgi:hypothetical protein
VERGIVTNEEVLEMVRVVDREMKRKEKGDDINVLQCFLPERVILKFHAIMQHFKRKSIKIKLHFSPNILL